MFKTEIIGNLTADPVAKTIGKNQAAEFCVASRTTRKNAEGEYITNFVNVTMFGPQADFIVANAKKGNKVYVDGHFAVVPYTTKDGKPAQSLNLTANSFELMSPLGPKAAAGAPKRQQASAMPNYDAQSPDQIF